MGIERRADTFYNYKLRAFAMLPILPALILLLLHGPSNIERLAREGRLPAALDAIHREMDRAPVAATATEQAIIASLLATTDPHLSHALFSLLRPESPGKPAKALEPREPQTPAEPPEPTPADGFSECRRTRDGPRVIA